MNTPRPCLGPQPRLSLPKPLGLQIGGHTGWSSRGKFSLNSSPGTVSRASTVRQHTLHFGVPPRYLPAPDGYPPVGVGVGAGGGGDGQSRGPGKGVPAPEATHVSSRIFLSATTSPVNLFLALYTTPYVPSPIFSTFWKFSMER